MGKMKLVEENSADAESDATALAKARRALVGEGGITALPEISAQPTKSGEQAVSENVVETAEQSAIVEQMTADIRREVRSRRWRLNLYALGSMALIYTILPVMSLLSSIIAFNGETKSSALAIGYLLFIVFGTPFAILLIERKYRHRTGKTTGKIDTINDLRMVGPLAEMLAIESLPVREVAKVNLTRLLPQLKASDSALLNGAQRKQLDRFVRPDLFHLVQRDFMELFSRRARQRDIEFQLAIFKAYEQVGEWRSLKAVRSVAYPASGSRRGVPMEIIEGARRCLLFLEMAVEKETISKQLLRPSCAAEVMTDTLLRPAMEKTSDEAPDTLLRAADIVVAQAASKEREVQP